jgi:shikimate dehydrogenase
VSGAPVRLAVLGDPLRYTRSPELHVAGCAALGIACESFAIRTTPADLGPRLGALAGEGYRGVNITHPLKADVLRWVPEVSERARHARSANTVGLDAGGWWADSTDGIGFLDLLRELGGDPARERVMLLGAGGSARSLAAALEEAGAAPPVVSARDPEKRRRAFGDVPARWTAWRSDEERAALGAATLIVNCTPLAGRDSPAPLESLARGAVIVDLVYGPDVTPWVTAARAAGFAAYDGLGLLVHQARHALARWFGRDVPLAPLARAVGWPR